MIRIESYTRTLQKRERYLVLSDGCEGSPRARALIVYMNLNSKIKMHIPQARRRYIHTLQILTSRQTLTSPVLLSHMSVGATLPGPIEPGWISIKGLNSWGASLMMGLSSFSCTAGIDFNDVTDTHTLLWCEVQCFCWCSLLQ